MEDSKPKKHINKKNKLVRPNRIRFDKPCYTVKEVCVIFNVTRQTIYKWIKSKKFPARKIGSKVVFLKKDIEDFLYTLPKPVYKNGF